MAAAETIEGGKSPPIRAAARPTADLDQAGPLVDIGGLYVTFQRGGRSVPALRGIDLQIARGEILGLVGESGSGKSVLGLSLLGLLAGDPPPAISGVAMVCGVDMVAATAEQRRGLRRRDLGAVFQDPMTSLNPTMRVGRQVAEAAGTESEAVRLLDAVGVPEPRRRLRAFPHELSGGLRQRVMIAMAVAGDPALVVADEPTTALDVTVQAQILELLRHLCDSTRCTFVLVTHDLGVAAQVADRVAVLYAGRLAEIGRAADVLQSPAHPYSVGLLRSRLTLAARREGPLPTLPGEPPDPRALPDGCPFGPRCALHVDECDDGLPTLVAAGRHPGVAACIRLSSPDLTMPPALETWAALAARSTASEQSTPASPASPATPAADAPASPATPAADAPASPAVAAPVAGSPRPIDPAPTVAADAVPGSPRRIDPAPPAEPAQPAAAAQPDPPPAPPSPPASPAVAPPRDAGTAAATAMAVRLVAVERDFVLRSGWRTKDRLHALRGIDLQVAEGESVALVGESGCGKSTLLRIVAGLLAPTRGTVELGHGARPQMVFQDAGASLTPWLKVGELVGERLRAEGAGRGERASRVRDALALVGLPAEVAEAKAAQLSGGQRQRVALARATIVPPEVLLCDEPTSALDVSLAATVLNLLGRIRRELGMAMIFVTHDLGAARVVADQVAVMYLGRIVEIGPAEEVVAAPRHPYTKALLAAVPAVGMVRSPLQGEPASPLRPPSGCPFHPRCDVALESCSSAEVPLIQVGRRSVGCVRANEPGGAGGTVGAPAGQEDAEVVVAARR